MIYAYILIFAVVFIAGFITGLCFIREDKIPAWMGLKGMRLDGEFDNHNRVELGDYDIADREE